VKKIRPAAKREAARSLHSRVRVHLVCVTLGILLAILSTCAPLDSLAHFAPALPVLPSVVQEIADRFLGL
jgi:hypothetical protein